ncbi:MAG: hypothetical protein ABRQ27_14835 [Clostridiaceae bacterium]
MSKGKVRILKETNLGNPGEWHLCFQYCCYEYGDGNKEYGYRFIWRKPNGDIQASREQARLPSVAEMMILTSRALSEGWGHYNCDSRGFDYNCGVDDYEDE